MSHTEGEPPSNAAPDTKQGVGARLLRKEDDRFMRGRGQYVADIRLSGLQDVAFVRSPLAHARIKAIHVPQRYRDVVFTAADLTGIKPIRAVSGLPGFKISEQPILATGKVRHVGELIAMCVAPTRAEAEDIAASVTLELEELPAVYDMLGARDTGSALVHEHWGDNVFLESAFEVDITAAFDAPIKVTREISTARQCMSPLEGRGVVATFDHRLDQLTLYTGAQMPHIVRNGLSDCMGMDQGQIRIVSPDIGGGFGHKGILLPEEVCLAWLATRKGYTVRWIEDRREHLTASANCREHSYKITVYADRDGRLRGIDCEATVDSGAYSSYPFSACLEAAQVASILPGPYRMPAYRCRTFSVATNKCPILPYRGVARTGVCFALEIMLDAVAVAAGIEPGEVRLRNLIGPDEMPFDNITKKHFDSGDYPQAMNRALAAIDIATVRSRQRSKEVDGRLIGVGLSIYCEQAAHGTSIYAGWGIPMVPGHEQANARVTPDGGLEIRVGVHSHGQGLETSLAQVAYEILGIETRKIRVVHGDTAITPYSTGTWGSRSMVMAGGAVATACIEIGERAKRIGAKLLQLDPATVTLRDGRVCGPNSSIGLAEIAHTWYRRPQDLPSDVDPGGLESTSGYKPQRDSGTFSYAAHAVIVAVDPDLGDVEILDYVIVEDGGVLVNPMIVDGQIYGGLAQGIGTALYEEMPFDSAGQPLATTLADYLLPGPAEASEPRLDHMETPSPYTMFGVKGIGEGGAIAPPAAIANAVNDALRPLGVELLHSPISPRRIVEAVLSARDVGKIGRMKAAAFSYERPTDLNAALALMAKAGGTARIIAGGQSLGPMLNLRLVEPDLIVDISGLSELKRAEREGDELVIGACVTHGDIEDGRIPDVTRGAMQRVASAIAYRAVRNRGTIGGSLSHADPAADWVSALSALGARVTLRRAAGARDLTIEEFITGALESALQPGEIVVAVRVPAMKASAHWGYVKACRKHGEFAHAIAAVLIDPEQATARAVIGALEAAPIVLGDAAALFGGRVTGDFKQHFDARVADGLLMKAGVANAADRHIHVAVLGRAVNEAAA